MSFQGIEAIGFGDLLLDLKFIVAENVEVTIIA